MARLFFAVWPGDAASAELALIAESLAGLAGGKPMPAQKIHMTLAFLGSLDEGQASRATAAGARVKGVEIGMAIDQVGSFRRARVGWAGPSRQNAQLVALQDRLATGLKAAGFMLEDRPFAPHATLVRKIAKPVPTAPMAPIEWRSRELTLVESTGNGRYEVVESWGLGGN